VAGIIVAYWINPLPGYILFPVFAFFLFIVLSSKLPIAKSSITPVSILIFFFLVGAWRYGFFNEKAEFARATQYKAVLLEYPIQKQKSWKVEAKLEMAVAGDSVFNQHEKIIVYFENDSLCRGLIPGNTIVFRNQPTEVRNMGNPFEFDYKRYLSNQKIYRSVYLSSDSWKKVGQNHRFQLRVFAETVRQKLLDIYSKNQITGERFAILSALTLGYKDALDPEAIKVFSQTGAMHVLSVSGLHVAIVFAAVNLLFGFLRRSKKGKILFLVLSVAFLWLFALITGMSPSVLRASLMFSFVIVGENMKRPANIYNTLAASAFVLLLFNPNLIFDIGFQLSYIAVFGIVFFQPGINKIFEIDNRILRWCWSLFSVSVAAQLATLPLTLFYFKQFPTYFWLSNFIIIPAAFVLIFLGIAILIFSFIPAISGILATVTSWLVGGSYFLLKSFDLLPFSVFTNIHVHPIQLFLMITCLLSLMLFITTTAKRYQYGFMISLVAIFMVETGCRLSSFNQSRMIVYNSNSNPIIHLISGGRNYILTDGKLPDYGFERSAVENVRTKYFLNQPVILHPDTFFVNKDIAIAHRMVFFGGKTIGIYPSEKSQPGNLDFILTNQSQTDFHSKTKVICSGYFSDQKETPSSHYLRKDGAYIFNFKNNSLHEGSIQNFSNN
jgi:competence protein ComEC